MIIKNVTLFCGGEFVMKILLKNITEKTMEYIDEVACESIDNNGDNIKFNDNINFNGTLRKGEDYVEIAGLVTANFVTNCHACGEEAKNSIKFEIFETYRREPADDEYELIGDEVNFDEMVLENIRLNLPIRILCKEDCMGVCLMCGKNLNREECGCEREVKKESPFDVLNKLLD